MNPIEAAQALPARVAFFVAAAVQSPGCRLHPAMREALLRALAIPTPAGPNAEAVAALMSLHVEPAEVAAHHTQLRATGDLLHARDAMGFIAALPASAWL